MVELCLMASHGYTLGFHPGHVSNRLSEEFHHVLPYHRSNQELVNSLSFSLITQQKGELRSNGELLDSNHFARTIDSTSKRPMLVDFQDTNSDSVLLSFGIAERCARHEKILKLLSSKPIKEQCRLLDLSMFYDLVGPQSLIPDLPQQPFNSSSAWRFNDDAQPLQSLIHPTQELYLNEPFLGRPLPCNCTGSEMNDVISAMSDFYMLKNTNKSSRQTMLVPYFERRRRGRANIGASKPGATETASLKSHDKAKTSQKKKTNARFGKERDIYNNSYLHTCESLLSMIVGREQEGKNVILSLKKSGPQLPHLLTQVSASIAGTGIAVVLSVLCRVACSNVPFCGSRVLSTGLGLGLVWLSWAVNKLRDTVITIGKNNGRASEKEEEMMGNLDRNLKDIYFRVAAVMAVVVLKVA